MLAIGKGSKRLARNLTRPFDFYNTGSANVTFRPHMVRCGTLLGRFRHATQPQALSIFDRSNSLISCAEPPVTPS
jgi:hypothetical protein